MNFKTRLSVIMMAIAMIMVFTPMMTFAADSRNINDQDESKCFLWVGGEAVTETGEVVGEGISGLVFYDQDTNVLTLNNAKITGTQTIQEENNSIKSSIYFKDWPLTIELIGENTVGDTTGPDISIDADAELNIKGGGTLTAEGSSYAIWAAENCMLDNVSVALRSLRNAAISANKDFVIDDSSLTAESTGYEGIRVQRSLTISNSNIMATSQDTTAINANSGDISIIDSDVIAESIHTSETLYRMYAIEAYKGSIRVANSTVIAMCDNMAAVQAGKAIRLSGSEIVEPTEGTIGQNSDGYTIFDKNGAEATNVLISPAKLPGTMAAAGKTAAIRSKAKKLKRNTGIAASKAYTILRTNGQLTFKLVKASKSSGKFKVDSKTGKITVKKGVKNGTYKLTVNITDSGDTTHSRTDTNVTVTIKIRK